MAARRALVVDDDDDIRLLAAMAIQLGGWEVFEASGGATALDLARLHQPDVLLLDVMMPDMDGPTTCAHLRADPLISHIPVILLTAKIQATDMHMGQGLDLLGVIAKPFDPLLLAGQVDALLASHPGNLLSA